MSHILEVNNLNVYYKEKKPSLRSKDKKRVRILKDISFSVEQGEILGIAGESGCGKSTLAKTLCGLHNIYTGNINMTCTKPQMIFQDHAGSLNPSRSVKWILSEALRSDRTRHLSKDEIEFRVVKAASDVDFDSSLLDRKPRALSGGQRQRVCIAAAIIREPELIIADEPVSALDVTIQAKIVDLLLKLHERKGISTIFISHDLRVIYKLCDRVMVMKDGEIVEIGKRDEIYGAPKEDYTKELLKASGSIT